MKLTHKMLAAAALAGAPVIAADASAQTYNLNFGSPLTAQIYTVPSTGGNQTVVGISGTLMGQMITGLIGDPYTPAIVDYDQVTQLITPYATTTLHPN